MAEAAAVEVAASAVAGRMKRSLGALMIKTVVSRKISLAHLAAACLPAPPRHVMKTYPSP